MPAERRWPSSAAHPCFWLSPPARGGDTTTITAAGTLPPARIARIWSASIRMGAGCQASVTGARQLGTKRRCAPVKGSAMVRPGSHQPSVPGCLSPQNSRACMDIRRSLPCPGIPAWPNRGGNPKLSVPVAIPIQAVWRGPLPASLRLRAAASAISGQRPRAASIPAPRRKRCAPPLRRRMRPTRRSDVNSPAALQGYNLQRLPLSLKWAVPLKLVTGG